ncbi:EB1 domain-containing protein [Roridomyces roridus]|uniref:EB1 domain-containing protein n=1 Tax=Roridomyces roridus TaxID=1738132 RepID=A0AAD7BSF8_9AGAR|nr:EB1 domain-containing protein [Roridomyces roridus]
MAGASRTELLQWLNDLLQLNYTKVEQCGTGGAYVQILDSIYGDLPMSRVKMQAKQEYEYLANYKVLQAAFKSKKIDKPILVEKLVKCKMQDNLEFLQWIRRFWEANYAGGEYDAVGRRKGAPADPAAPLAPRPPSSTAGRAGGRTPVGAARAHTPGSTARARTPSSNAHAQAVQAQMNALTNQVREMSLNVEGLEKERDFYFEKLRSIEMLVQQRMEDLEGTGTGDQTLSDIQKILYTTEDGFEVPEGEGYVDPEEETF